MLTPLAAPPPSPFRRGVWEILARGRQLVAGLQQQHRRVHAEVGRGKPFPVLTPDQPRPPSPSNT